MLDVLFVLLNEDRIDVANSRIYLIKSFLNLLQKIFSLIFELYFWIMWLSFNWDWQLLNITFIINIASGIFIRISIFQISSVIWFGKFNTFVILFPFKIRGIKILERDVGLGLVVLRFPLRGYWWQWHAMVK